MATITRRKSRKRQQPKPQKVDSAVNMQRVATIILGGGQGTRLFPLTLTRCKPAITFGGRYRIIDFPLSNAINSGCNKVFILTQFLSSSLHQHIYRTYQFDAFSTGFIELLQANQNPGKNTWMEGTANAVRENLEYFIETPVDYFLVISGDQLFDIDFADMVKFAQEKEADIVVSAIPVKERTAKKMRLMKLNRKHFLTDFTEMTNQRTVLNQFKASDTLLAQAGLPPNSARKYLGTMGVFLFKKEILIELLQNEEHEDFCQHILPRKVKENKVAAYLYKGYWENISTIKSFHRANIDLTSPNSTLNLYDENNPVYIARNNLPGPKIRNTLLNDSIICEGVDLEADEIKSSIVGPRAVIKKGSVIENSYIMGNDDHAPDEFYIGEKCIIQNAIVDKNCQIGNRVKLVNKKKLKHYDSDMVYIRDGIIVVTRGATLPDGFIL